MDELSEEDKLTVARARKAQRFMSQPFHVAEVFTGFSGKFVPLEETVTSFAEILKGTYDDIPEQGTSLRDGCTGLTEPLLGTGSSRSLVVLGLCRESDICFIPRTAFYMVGNIKDVQEKATKMAKSLEGSKKSSAAAAAAAAAYSLSGQVPTYLPT